MRGGKKKKRCGEREREEVRRSEKGIIDKKWGETARGRKRERREEKAIKHKRGERER